MDGRGAFEDQMRRMMINNAMASSENLTPQSPTFTLGPDQTRQQTPRVLPPHLNAAPNGYPATAPPGHYPPSNVQGRQGYQQPQQTPYGSSANPSSSTHAHLAPHRQAQLRQQQHQPTPMDPNAFSRGSIPQQPRQLFDPQAHRGPTSTLLPDAHVRQSQYLENLVNTEIPNVEMSRSECDQKEAFRAKLEGIIHEVCATDPQRLPKVSLECFGSFKTGFATAGSDMDLVIVLQDGSPYTACFSLMEDDLPLVLEKRLLQLGFGARLLTRTRVPILKICQLPDDCLLDKLRQEREKWDVLPTEKKYPHLHQNDDDEAPAAVGTDAAAKDETEANKTGSGAEYSGDSALDSAQKTGKGAVDPGKKTSNSSSANALIESSTGRAQVANERTVTKTQGSQKDVSKEDGLSEQPEEPTEKHLLKTWTRERKAGPLDFPSDGVGIQCDINFFNPLGLHNTQLLRCYSLADWRVRPMVLFVKAWAKRRKINSSYSGTLSSYGYVLMVLHYLMNVAQPAVIPNLQLPWRPNQFCTPHGATRTEVDGWEVNFWRNENEIIQAVQTRQMSPNTEQLGSLLKGFFAYYSNQFGDPRFYWMQEVISLRSPGGILHKANKGWTKAVTEENEGKIVQHRYLFCIEDPFELSHNVARTVTHNGIIAIRDEFRRAARILKAVGMGLQPNDGELFAKMVEAEDFVQATAALKLDGAAGEGSASRTQNGKAVLLSAQQRGGMGAHPTTANQGAMHSNDQQRGVGRVRGPRGGRRGGPFNGAPRGNSGTVSKPLDVTDTASFPALGAGGAAAKPRQPT
jgi:terminal uridylyltransferase